MLWVYGHYRYYFNSFSAGTVFIRQNLTSTDVRFWRIKTVPALKGLRVKMEAQHAPIVTECTFCFQWIYKKMSCEKSMRRARRDYPTAPLSSDPENYTHRGFASSWSSWWGRRGPVVSVWWAPAPAPSWRTPAWRRRRGRGRPRGYYPHPHLPRTASRPRGRPGGGAPGPNPRRPDCGQTRTASRSWWLRPAENKHNIIVSQPC